MIMKNFKVFCPFKHKGTHKGVDLIPESTSVTPEITAYDDGEVIFTQVITTTNKSTGTAGMGTAIAIRHSGNIITRYQHIKSLKVKKGDKVKKNQPIAIFSRPTNGNSTGPHLHFDISFPTKPNKDYIQGKFMGEMRYYVDPLPYIIEKAEQPKAETKTKIVMVALNVRSGPGMNYPRLKVLAPGTVVNVLEERDGWTRIDINRWVATKHLK